MKTKANHFSMTLLRLGSSKMFNINLENPRLDKGIETRPFVLDVLVRGCGNALKYDPPILDANGRASRLKSFKIFN